jgi:hypothetical protein
MLSGKHLLEGLEGAVRGHHDPTSRCRVEQQGPVLPSWRTSWTDVSRNGRTSATPTRSPS